MGEGSQWKEEEDSDQRPSNTHITATLIYNIPGTWTITAGRDLESECYYNTLFSDKDLVPN